MYMMGWLMCLEALVLNILLTIINTLKVRLTFLGVINRLITDVNNRC